jgi:heme-degrading monooxygenase HmoA
MVRREAPHPSRIIRILRSLPEMIARLWSAHTTPALVDSYLLHFEHSVRPELQRVDGFLGATVCTRPLPGGVEILVSTYWTSFAAIDAFAGADRDSAVVAAEAAPLLTDFDKRVRHYEVALSQFPSRAS